METKFTPGPWETTELDGIATGVRIGDAVVEGAYQGGNYDEISDADFRLIAAAPDLLAALLRCRFDSLNMSLEDLQFCRAAIAKATGA